MASFFVFILFAFLAFVMFMMGFIMVDLTLDQRLSRKIGKWFDRKFGV
jgi:hypothetical protein